MRRNGNRRCTCRHYQAAHRMRERSVGACTVPGCTCEVFTIRDLTPGTNAVPAAKG